MTVVVFGFLYFHQPESQILDTGKDTNFFANFLPFGDNPDVIPSDINPPTDVSGYIPEAEIKAPEIRLKKVSSFPIAGFGVFMKERYKDIPTPDKSREETISSPSTPESETIKSVLVKPIPPPTEFVPFLRYVEKTTGNIYQTFADKIDERKFSGTLIPKVYEAFFGNKGESVIMRYLKQDNQTIETFFGSLPKEYLGADGGVNEIKGPSFLPENISDMSVSPDFLKIFYLFDLNDFTVGTTLSLATNTKSQVFDSPFTEWLSSWPNNQMITITTKPSSAVSGYMYAINPDKKDLNKILGGINGLTTLTSLDGKIVLYGNDNLSLSIFNINTGNTTPLSIRTLPEKCVWGGESNVIYCAVPKFINQESYPDSWYKGEVSFFDEIWKIDTKNGNTIMVLDPIFADNGESVDGIKLSLDENENYLFFVNKKDSYLWELKLR